MTGRHDADTARQAELALIEAQVMGESVGALVESLLNGEPDGKTYSILNAINACLSRLHAAVDPAVESFQAARS